MTTELNWQQRGIGYVLGQVQALSLQAASGISPNLAVALDSNGKVAAAGADSLKFVGISPERAYIAADYLPVAVDGCVPATVDLPVIAGQRLKCGAAGKLIQHLDDSLDAVTMATSTGAGITTQPSNDGVEIVSSDNSDTTQTITVYFTTNGGGDVVSSETWTLTGTTQVVLDATDVQLVLGAELSAATVGDITIREASGNVTVLSISSPATSGGVVAVAAGTTQYAYNRVVTAVAGGASTKQIGFIGTDSAGDALLDSQALNGTSAVNSNQQFRTVTKILTGDVAGATTWTVKTSSTEDDENLVVARAMENQTVAGNTCLVKIL